MSATSPKVVETKHSLLKYTIGEPPNLLVIQGEIGVPGILLAIPGKSTINLTPEVVDSLRDCLKKIKDKQSGSQED